MIKKLSAALFASASLSVSAAPVSSEWADTTLNLNEVSVTAIKLSDKVDRLPVASTVIGRGQIERLNIVTMKSVSELAPNFYIPDYGSRMTSSIYVRGIGARIDQPVVGLNVDNVPYMNKDNYDFDMPDIERIEVLRGPQSTLYGRNTMGGLINIYTLSPMRYQGVRISAEYATANSVKASVGAYGKLNDRLGMSLSAYFTHTDGFFRNRYNGKKCDKENQGSFRWKTVWNPSASVSVENAASFQISRQGGYPYEYIETGEISYNDTCYYRRTSVADGVTVRWRLGDVSLSSITSLQYTDDDMTLDQDFLPEDYFTLTQAKREWAFTQDFIGRGTAGSYSWLGGLFGFYKHTRMDAPVTFKEDGISHLITGNVNSNNKIPIRLDWDEDRLLLDSRFTNPVYGVALYHQSSLELGRWELSLGLRLDVEHNRLDYHSLCNTSYTISPKNPMIPIPTMPGQTVDIDDDGSLSETFVEFLPKISAIIAFTSAPLAMQWPWPRWVDSMRSVSFKAAQMPVAMASSPMYRWVKPGISPLRKSFFTDSSNARIVHMVSYIFTAIFLSVKGAVFAGLVICTGATPGYGTPTSTAGPIWGSNGLLLCGPTCLGAAVFLAVAIMIVPS